MLRPGSAGSNTTADHLTVLDDAITAVPAKHRRRLMVTCDGAGASHGLIEHLDELATRPGRQLIYSVGWELGERERRALTRVPSQAWQAAVDGRGQVRQRRAQDPALPGPARRCPADPQQPAPPAEGPRHLALGRCRCHRLGPDNRPAASTLTSSTTSLRPTEGNPGDRGTPSHTGPPAGSLSYPHPKIKIITRSQQPGRQATSPGESSGPRPGIRRRSNGGRAGHQRQDGRTGFGIPSIQYAGVDLLHRAEGRGWNGRTT
jgi:hypothetical protein